MPITSCILTAALLVVHAAAVTPNSGPALTIYNQDFAVVREIIPLDLAEGLNDVSFAETTAHVEPDSVFLRDPTGARQLRIIEQNFRGDPVSQALLLSMYEGKSIDFLVVRDGKEERVAGRIVRSSYVMHHAAMDRYGPRYERAQRSMGWNSGASEPIIEYEGRLRFGLPGVPLFPELTDDSILKPTLHWQLEVDEPGRFDAELAYVTGGMSWKADYNIVAPERGDTVDLVGWVTMDNQSGRTFDNARIKLIAGDINKVLDESNQRDYVYAARYVTEGDATVTDESFDEYHLYTLAFPTTLRDRETKQVEFVRASGVQAARLYVYDGAKLDTYRGWNSGDIRSNADYGTKCNRNVWVMVELGNSQSNHLGIALPKGRLRFYRQDAGGQLEFTGEDVIGHTPKDETIRVYTGNAFDIVGDRVRSSFNGTQRTIDESFRISLRNHKDEAVEIRVVEHLYRWTNWTIGKNSSDFKKTDSQTIEFRIALARDEEKTIEYTVHYAW